MKLREYAADLGTPQVEDGTGIVLSTNGANAGGPNAPVNPKPTLVSTSRHGVIATNESGAVAPTASAEGCEASIAVAAPAFRVEAPAADASVFVR